MKKRIVTWMLGAMMAVTLLGCGDDKKNSTEGTEVMESTETGTEEAGAVTAQSSAFLDIKGSDYVKLCDYSAIPVSISGDYEVDESDALEYFEQMFLNYGPFYTEDVDKTTIGEGDIVNVDYVGKLDGEAFEGGSAEGQLIDVYGNCAAGGATSYIDGFTEGLKGASVGDVIDCDVTFPEDYQNTDLAGKAVVFTFTVNSIQKEMEIGDVDDAFAKEQFQVDTVDEMYEQIRSYLEQMAVYNKQRDTAMAIQDYLVENCTVDVPQDYLVARLADYKRQFLESNCNGDESQLEDYATTYYGKSAEELEAYWEESMEESISLELILDAITEEMGLTLDEDTYQSSVVSMAQSSYGTVESMYNMYGYGDAVYGEAYLRKLYLYDQALDQVLETAVVTVTPADDAVESVEDTEAVESTQQ